MQAAVAKAKMKFKPLIDEEDERRRASAAAKLRALDEAIAKRKAEEEKCEPCCACLLHVYEFCRCCSSWLVQLPLMKACSAVYSQPG